MDFDPKQIVLDLGTTLTRLSDGTVDEGDLVVLDSLRKLVEDVASGQLEKILEEEKTRQAFGASGAILSILVSMLWPE